MSEVIPSSLEYDLVPFMLGAILAVVSDQIIRIREVAVILTISLSALVIWSLLGAGAPGLVGLLGMLLEQTEAAVSSGLLIGVTMGKYGATLMRSLSQSLKPRRVKPRSKSHR